MCFQLKVFLYLSVQFTLTTMKAEIPTAQNAIDHFFKGAFSIDVVLFTYIDNQIKFLLQKKQDHPIENEWGLPGKLISPNQDTDEAVQEMMEEMLGKTEFYKRQLKTFSELDRHPLGRIITIAFYGLIANDVYPKKLKPNLKWVNLEGEYDLTLDHNKILEEAKIELKDSLMWKPDVFHLLPKKFVFADLIEVYRILFNKNIDVANFRKKVLASKLVKPTGEFKPRYKSHGRPAEYFIYSPKSKQKIEKDGDFFNF